MTPEAQLLDIDTAGREVIARWLRSATTAI
jgi:hypothetical protein